MQVYTCVCQCVWSTCVSAGACIMGAVRVSMCKCVRVRVCEVCMWGRGVHVQLCVCLSADLSF